VGGYVSDDEVAWMLGNLLRRIENRESVPQSDMNAVLIEICKKKEVAAAARLEGIMFREGKWPPSQEAMEKLMFLASYRMLPEKVESLYKDCCKYKIPLNANMYESIIIAYQEANWGPKFVKHHLLLRIRQEAVPLTTRSHFRLLRLACVQMMDYDLAQKVRRLVRDQIGVDEHFTSRYMIHVCLVKRPEYLWFYLKDFLRTNKGDLKAVLSIFHHIGRKLAREGAYRKLRKLRTKLNIRFEDLRLKDHNLFLYAHARAMKYGEDGRGAKVNQNKTKGGRPRINYKAAAQQELKWLMKKGLKPNRTTIGHVSKIFGYDGAKAMLSEFGVSFPPELVVEMATWTCKECKHANTGLLPCSKCDAKPPDHLVQVLHGLLPSTCVHGDMSKRRSGAPAHDPRTGLPVYEWESAEDLSQTIINNEEDLDYDDDSHTSINKAYHHHYHHHRRRRRHEGRKRHSTQGTKDRW